MRDMTDQSHHFQSIRDGIGRLCPLISDSSSRMAWLLLLVSLAATTSAAVSATAANATDATASSASAAANATTSVNVTC